MYEVFPTQEPYGAITRAVGFLLKAYSLNDEQLVKILKEASYDADLETYDQEVIVTEHKVHYGSLSGEKTPLVMSLWLVKHILDELDPLLVETIDAAQYR